MTSLRTARQAAGLTQRQLAVKSGVNIRQIQRIESGSSHIKNVSAQNFIALCDVLGVDPHELLEKKEPKWEG